MLIHVAGYPSESFVITEHLADFVAHNLPHVSVVKHLVPEGEWDNLVTDVCSEFRFEWESREAPFVWTEGVLIGTGEDFVVDMEKRFGLKLADAGIPEDRETIDRLVEESNAVAIDRHEKKLVEEHNNAVVQYIDHRSIRLDLLDRVLKLIAEYRAYLKQSVGCESSLLHTITTLNSAKQTFDRWSALKEKIENAQQAKEDKESAEVDGQGQEQDDQRVSLDDNWSDDDLSPRDKIDMRAELDTPRGERVFRVKRLKKALITILRRVRCDGSLGVSRIGEKMSEFLKMFEALDMKTENQSFLVDIHDLIEQEMATIAAFGPILELYTEQCESVTVLLGKLADIEKSVLKPKLRLSLGGLNLNSDDTGEGDGDGVSSGGGKEDEGEKEKVKEKVKVKAKASEAIDWDPFEIMETANSLHSSLKASYDSFGELLARIVEVKEVLREKKKKAEIFEDDGDNAAVEVVEEAKKRVALSVHYDP